MWNGSSWTEVNDLNTAREGPCKGGGTYTDVLCIAGSTPPGTTKTESWNGTSWTEVADLAVARENAASAMAGGPAAVVLGGGAPSYAIAEEFTAPSTFSKQNLGQVYFNSDANAFKVTEQPVPGGTWASGGNLNTARSSGAGAGTQTAGMFSGGRGGPPSFTNYAITEFYDGSSWTEVNDLNTARYALMGANAGSQTATLVFGGTPPDTAATESWDGTNWTEVKRFEYSWFKWNRIWNSTSSHSCCRRF